MKFHLRTVLALGLLAILGTACQPHQYKATVLNPPKPVDDFSMPASDGSTFTLSGHKDRAVILYFGYTNCPDICPATLTEIQQVLQKIGPDAAAKVDVAFVTVDPERDTLDALKTYLGHFGTNFVGLRASDDAQLTVLTKQFGIYYQAATPDPTNGYTVDHTPAVMLIRNMGIRALFSSDISAADFAADLQELLKGE